MTIRFVTDEHIARATVAGLQRKVASVDVVRVQDVGLRTLDDPAILQWAADQGPALITHDIATLPDHARERVATGLTMPGMFVVPSSMAIGEAIDELALIADASEPDEWANRVVYLPLH